MTTILTETESKESNLKEEYIKITFAPNKCRLIFFWIWYLYIIILFLEKFKYVLNRPDFFNNQRKTMPFDCQDYGQ